jgi:hypothetical protein
MKKTIPIDVLDVLKRCKTSDHLLWLPGQLDRRLYVQVNQVLELLGAKWSRRDQAHVFTDTGDAGELIAIAIETGEVIDHKKLYQFFETPEALARRMVQLAEIGPRHKVLEPSAGAGAIVKQISTPVSVYELEPGRADKLSKMPGVSVLGLDFMAAAPTPEFDRVIMNPPFRAGQDVDHVVHACDFLKAGGRLVAITSPGWTYRNDVRHSSFRAWMDEAGHYREQLPPGTFKASGTNVSAMLLVINKPKA